MDIKTKETFSEVYCILNMLGESYIMKLPSKLYQMIKEEKDDEYNPQYDITIALEKQNIKRETLAMIALFHLNYWCDSQEEKQELKNLLNKNEIKYQTELRRKYNPDNIFKNKNLSKKNEENILKETVSVIEYKENIFKKMINKILKLLRK